MSTTPMYPNARKVSAAARLARAGESASVEPFGLRCRELGLILQNERDAGRRLVLAQRFAGHLTDAKHNEAVAFINFATERQTLLGVLRAE